MFARAGMVLSAAGHAGVACGILLFLAQPNAYQVVREQALMVDVVTPQEAPVQSEKPQEQRKDQPQAAPTPGSASEKQADSETPPAPQAAAAAPSGPPPPLPSTLPSVSAGMLSLYNLRVPGSDFDAKADRQADLSKDQLAAFQAHLRKCWRAPAGLAPTSRTRVVLRVSLTAQGALAGDPILVEAAASAEGPLVFQAAIRAVETCQPYSFLPPERYGEWKVLDVPFSPRDMAGG